MAVLRAQNLTRQLLTFARGGTPVKKVFGIAKLVRDTAQFALSGSNVRSEFRTPDDLWPVEADEGQISQVIQNIVINAEQAMPEGGKLVVQTRVQDGHVVCSVEDTGVGMTEEILDRLFAPFFTTKEVNQGTGLGLPVVHGIVTSYGGTIEVASTPGKGTTFTIRLPIKPAAGRENGPES